MSLSAYKAFMSAPSPIALADNASLHYITTLTSLNDAAAIMKHFTVLERILKIKEQKVLDVVDGGNALAVDVETTIEFTNGGGAYLPGLDDNFLSDRIATFPITHIVHFDAQHRIVQIRLQWDQASLLKQVEVMGARQKSWPVRDGKDQIRLIATNAAGLSQRNGSQGAGRGADEVSVERSAASSRRSTKNAMNDPHATLDLFQPRDINQEVTPSRPIAPRMQSAKPPPRDLDDLFVGENATAQSPSNNGSPSKQNIPVKAGGGKNYKGNRLFEETEEEKSAPTPASSVKTNPKKYEHFEFGDGEDTPKAREGRPSRARHQSNWDFDDFVTPEKTKTKVLSQNVRHFGWSDDEEEISPVRRPVVHKERPNLHANFEFQDDGTPEGQRQPAPSKGRMQNKGMGLYRDHVLGDEPDDDDVPKGDSKRALNDVTTHVKNDNRKKDFGASWEMNDNSPAHDKTTFKESVPEIKKKATTTNWSHYDNSPQNRGINIAGNGMGSRKGTQFSLYEEDPDQAKKENKGIKSMGNGMGGRKGTGFDWDF